MHEFLGSVTYARGQVKIIRRGAAIGLKAQRSIRLMSSKKNKKSESESERKSERESFTEDGINFWRNPLSPNRNFLAQYRLSTGQKKTIGCGTNERGKAYSHAIKKREQQEHEVLGTDGNKLISIDCLCDEFIAEKKAEGLKPDTLKMLQSMTNRIRGYRYQYSKKAKAFDKFYVEKNGRDVPKLIDGKMNTHDLTQAMFDTYIDQMHIKVLADGTLRTLIGRLTSMFLWAKQQGYATPEVNFKKWNKKVKYSPMRSRKFDDSELENILDWLKHKSKRGKHNYYRLLCCSELGLRIAEVCSIMKEDVDPANTTLRVARLKKGSTVLEKLKITKRLATELEYYISHLPKEQVYLFEGRNGKPMKASSEWFRHACRALNIDETRGKLVLHCARSKFITDQIDEGLSLPKVMGSVGHKQVGTTMRYLQISDNQSQIDAIDMKDKKWAATNARIKELEAEVKKLKGKMNPLLDALNDL